MRLTAYQQLEYSPSLWCPSRHKGGTVPCPVFSPRHPTTNEENSFFLQVSTSPLLINMKYMIHVCVKQHFMASLNTSEEYLYVCLLKSACKFSSKVVFAKCY